VSDGRAALLRLLALGALAPAACLPLGAPAPDFPAETIRIVSGPDTFAARVEIASTARQRRTGLSRRTELSDAAGMLFLFEGEQPRATAFWMYRTRIPLGIAFLDSALVIRETREMRPCRSPLSLFCPSYPSGVPFRAALEMPGGYFARRGIGVGARVLRAAP
jgi:uncharacterized membrane protein (UPF0127 family)